MLATLAGAVLRLWSLGAQSLWIDEVFTWRSAAIGGRLGWSELTQDLRPLYAAILHAWGAVAGDGEWALRLPAALFGIATIPAMAWVSARWLGRETAAWAAWLTAGSPFFVWYAREARNYSLAMLLACVAAAVMLGMRERLTGAGVARWTAAVSAGMLSNFSFALLAPTHATWWLRRRERRPWLLLAATAALALVLSPWLATAFRTWAFGRLDPQPVVAGAEAPLRGETTFHAAAVPFAWHAFAVGYGVGPPLRELRAGAVAAARRHALEIGLVALVFAPLGIAGAIAVARRRRLLELVLWLVVPALLLSYVSWQNVKVFHPRYLAVCAPAFVLALAAGFADGPRAVRWVAGAAVAALWVVSLGRVALDPRYGKEDFRAAAAHVAAGARPGEQVVAVHTEDLADYYLRGRMPVVKVWAGWAADSVRLEQKTRERLAAAPGSWVMASRTEDLDPHGVFARMMARRWPAAPRSDFNGVTVWHVTGSGE